MKGIEKAKNNKERMKKVLLFSITLLVVAWLTEASASVLAAQGPGGEVRPLGPPPGATRGTTTTRGERTTNPGRRTYRVVRRGARNGPTPCEQANLVVRCGMSGCGISIEGRREPVFTDDSGEVVFSLSGESQTTVTVAKTGYETVKQSINLKCDEDNLFPVSLKGQLNKLRIRTSQPDAEIYVNEKFKGRSNAQGEFGYPTTEPSLLIEARKVGYLSSNIRIKDTRVAATGEVSLVLNPIPATVIISANVADALVQVDEQQEVSASEKISVPPGHHAFTVSALGYDSLTLDLTLTPDQTEKREASLQRLPLAALKEQAEKFYRDRAYQNVLKLCQYMLEADANYPAANRLAGLSYLAQQNYTKAESYLARALVGNEKITLPVRRHPRESFDMARGHDQCEALLILSKNELEFQGKQYPADNFKANFSHVQTLGIQLKSGSALYLSTKIIDSGGKKRDYNFYSYDRELSQAGRPYLEMVQHLLRAH
jgi:hypothetical protein